MTMQTSDRSPAPRGRRVGRLIWKKCRPLLQVLLQMSLLMPTAALIAVLLAEWVSMGHP